MRPIFIALHLWLHAPFRASVAQAIPGREHPACSAAKIVLLMSADLDTNVRVQLYREFLRAGRAPSVEDLAVVVGIPGNELRASLERLATGRAIALQPTSRDIMFAAPLSAVPTPYVVRVSGRPFFAPCIWDALGVIAMVKQDTAVETSCPCCGEAMTVVVRGGKPDTSVGIVHFGLPAKHWWENIVFT